MLYTYIVTLLLPSAFSYTIKVKGTIELGDQIAGVLREFKDRFLTQLDHIPSNKKTPTYSFPVAQNSDGMPEPQDFPYLNNIPIMEQKPEKDIRLLETVDVPLLEEIVSKQESSVHLYGNHNKPKGRMNNLNKPLNKIMV